MFKPEELGKRLKEERERLELTQKQVAEELGFNNYQSLLEIESGKREVKAWELAKLARIYHRSFDYFIEEVLAPQPEPIIIWRYPTGKNKLAEQHFIHYCENYEKLEKMMTTSRPKFIFLKLDQNHFVEKPYDRINELVSHYLKELNLGVRPACLLAKILEETHGVKLFYMDKAPGSAASIISSDFGPAILLNSNNVRWRRNYDLAHELFHLITWDIFDIKETCKGDIEDWAEIFGAAILMPEKEIRDEFNKRLDGNKISAPNLVELAVEFDVSIKALLLRLKDLKLLQEKEVSNYLQNYTTLRAIDNRSTDQSANKPSLSDRFINLSIKAFLLGKISKGKLAEYLEMPFGEVTMFLKKHGYDENEDYSREFTAT